MASSALCHVHSASSSDVRPHQNPPPAGSAAAGLARLKRLSTGRSESIEIEMTEIEHEPDSCHSPSAGVLRTSEYAGSREGVTAMLPCATGKVHCSCLSHTPAWAVLCWLSRRGSLPRPQAFTKSTVIWLCCWHAGRTVDDRLRRRKALEDAEISPSSNGHPGDGAQQPSGQPICSAVMLSSAKDQKAFQGTHSCIGILRWLRFTMAPTIERVNSVFSMRCSQDGTWPAKRQVVSLQTSFLLADCYLNVPSHATRR